MKCLVEPVDFAARQFLAAVHLGDQLFERIERRRRGAFGSQSRGIALDGDAALEDGPERRRIAGLDDPAAVATD
ncbi:hypothetical protein D3C71_1711150 [compost metagenome]